MDLSRILEEAIQLIKETGAFIRDEGKKSGFNNFKVKERNSFVTETDLESERRLTKGLSKIFPEAGFITEEKTVPENLGPFQWVIDPIDGTTNFIHGIPCYSISVALVDDMVPIIGIVYEITGDECFSAIRGGGSNLNGSGISTGKADSLSDSLIATGFPYYDFRDLESYLSVLEKFIRKTRGVRRIGSASVDLCYVACGRFDSFYELTLNVWDVAAGTLIVQEAGGKVTDFSGGGNYLFGREIIASSPGIAEQVQKIIQTEFYPAG